MTEVRVDADGSVSRRVISDGKGGDELSLTPVEIESERERFEKKASSFGLAMLRLGNGYKYNATNIAWRIWLAAIESERDRVRQRQDDAEALMRMQEPQRARMLEKWERGE